MFKVDPSESEDSPYQYDEPKNRLTPKRLANFAVVATGAVASVAFGLQVVGPSLANVMYPSSTQTETGSSLPTPVTEVSKAALEGANGPGFDPAITGISRSKTASTVSLEGAVPNEQAIFPSPTVTASPLQVPAVLPSFGNLSSATPYASASGTWQSTSEENDDDDRDDHDDRDDGDDREDDDDDREDDNDRDDDD